MGGCGYQIEKDGSPEEIRTPVMESKVYYVMQFLGHKNINNTLIYIQLEEVLFKNMNDEYVCKIASTIDEVKALIEIGFEYVCEFDGDKAFRKRK